MIIVIISIYGWEMGCKILFVVNLAKALHTYHLEWNLFIVNNIDYLRYVYM